MMSTATPFASCRCAIALGYDCAMLGAYAEDNDHPVTHGRLSDEVGRYILGLCDLAEERGARLQFFVQGMTLERSAELLRDVAARGHDIDQHTYSHMPLIAADLGDVEAQLARTNEAFEESLGFAPLGLRAPGMHRNGLQSHPQVQAAVLRQGLGFVSSDYSTRLRSHEHDKAADDNAARNLKHLQPRWYPTNDGDDGRPLLEIPTPGYSDRSFLDELRGSVDEWIAHIHACIEFAYNLGNLTYAPNLHPHTHLRHDPEMRVLRAVFDYAAKLHEPVAFVTYRDIYRRRRADL